MRRKEEREARRELIDREAGIDGGLDVADRVRQREGDLLPGVAPASRMWYPLIEMVFQRGTCAAQYAKMSLTSRSDGRGGKM